MAHSALRSLFSRWGIPLLLAAAAGPAVAQLRVATWNVTNYDGSATRTPAFQTAIYGLFQGRQMAPDILACQEFETINAMNVFRNLLNSAPGSPGDWAAAPWLSSPDTVNVFFYRTSKVDFISGAVIAPGSTSTTDQPRSTMRYDVSLKEYAPGVSTLSIYVCHMKAGDTAADRERRRIEAVRIRDNAEILPAGRFFMVAGDLNVYNNSEPAYVELLGSQINNLGRLFDPINRGGVWNNNGTFRFVHTQDPQGGGGVDDRFDQLLASANLLDGQGFDYIGNPAVPYSSSTWNDPNHSYRAWGNDGTSFNLPLTVTNNAMVGPTVAQAIIDSCAGMSGHMPVFLDLRVPAKVDSPTVLNLGTFNLGANGARTFTVRNAGNTALWTTNGIAALNYSFVGSSNLTVPSGNFVAGPGIQNVHTVTVNTSVAGTYSRTITINSSAPEQPVRIITVNWTVNRFGQGPPPGGPVLPSGPPRIFP